ncbi:Kelch domain-containing protein 4 [Balamuthia mandrillaris]
MMMEHREEEERRPIQHWKDLFFKEFIETESVHSDDMLFFVYIKPTSSKERFFVLRKNSSSLPSKREESNDEEEAGEGEEDEDDEEDDEEEVAEEGGEEQAEARRRNKRERREARKLRKRNRNIDWENTYFLNVVLNKLKYSIVIEVAPRPGTSKKVKAEKKGDTQKVCREIWASPTKVRMDKKTDEVTHTYPLIFFAVNHVVSDDVLLVSQPEELICVRLIAHCDALDSSSSSNASSSSSDKKRNNVVVFSGAVGHASIKKAYAVEAKKLNAKRAASWDWSRFVPSPSYYRRKREGGGSGNEEADKEQTDLDTEEWTVFLNMRGPGGKGSAQMAVLANSREKKAIEKSQSLPTSSPSSPSRWSIGSWLPRRDVPSLPEDADAFSCSLASIFLPIDSILSDVQEQHASLQL